MSALQLALLGWANAILDVSLYAAVRARYFFRPKVRSADRENYGEGDVILIRPCCGAEPNLELTLGSTSSMKSIGGALVVFALPAADDPARSAAEGAVAELLVRGTRAELAFTVPEGPNNKALQLARVLDRTPPERTIVVVIDSDVDLRDVDLRELTRPLRESPKLGLVYAPPVEAPLTPTLGDRLSAAVLSGSLHAFPLLSMLDSRSLVGKCFAVRRSSLDRAGGFASLRCVLGEDVELARRFRELGEKISPAPFVVLSRASGRTSGATLSRFVRWLMVVRRQRRYLLLSYPLLLAGTIPVSLLALASGVGWASISAIGLAGLARILSASAAARLAGRGTPGPLMIVAADLLIWGALLRAIFSGVVRWRGQRLAVGQGGIMRAADDSLLGAPTPSTGKRDDALTAPPVTAQATEVQ